LAFPHLGGAALEFRLGKVGELLPAGGLHPGYAKVWQCNAV
jgi:hypothetical protein